MSGWLDAGSGGGGGGLSAEEQADAERRRREAQALAEAASYEPPSYAVPGLGMDEPEPEPAPRPQYNAPDPGDDYTAPEPSKPSTVATHAAAAQVAGYAPAQYSGYDPGQYDEPVYEEPEPEIDPFGGKNWVAPGYIGYDQPRGDPQGNEVDPFGWYDSYDGYDPGYVAPRERDPFANSARAYELEQGWGGRSYDQQQDVTYEGVQAHYQDPFGNNYDWDPNARGDPLPTPEELASGDPRWAEYLEPGVLEGALQERRNYEYSQLVAPNIGQYRNAQAAGQAEYNQAWGEFAQQQQALRAAAETYREGARGQQQQAATDMYDYGGTEGYRETVRGPQQTAATYRSGLETDRENERARLALSTQQSRRFDELVAGYQREMIGGNIAGYGAANNLQDWELGLVEAAAGDNQGGVGARESWLQARGLQQVNPQATLTPYDPNQPFSTRFNETVGALFEPAMSQLPRVSPHVDKAFEAGFGAFLPGRSVASYGEVLGVPGQKERTGMGEIPGTILPGALAFDQTATEALSDTVMGLLAVKRDERSLNVMRAGDEVRRRDPEVAFWVDLVLDSARDIATGAAGVGGVYLMGDAPSPAAIRAALPQAIAQAPPPPPSIRMHTAPVGDDPPTAMPSPGGSRQAAYGGMTTGPGLINSNPAPRAPAPQAPVSRNMPANAVSGPQAVTGPTASVQAPRNLSPALEDEVRAAVRQGFADYGNRPVEAVGRQTPEIAGAGAPGPAGESPFHQGWLESAERLYPEEAPWNHDPGSDPLAWLDETPASAPSAPRQASAPPGGAMPDVAALDALLQRIQGLPPLDRREALFEAYALIDRVGEAIPAGASHAPLNQRRGILQELMLERDRALPKGRPSPGAASGPSGPGAAPGRARMEPWGDRVYDMEAGEFVPPGGRAAAAPPARRAPGPPREDVVPGDFDYGDSGGTPEFAPEVFEYGKPDYEMWDPNRRGSVVRPDPPPERGPIAPMSERERELLAEQAAEVAAWRNWGPGERAPQPLQLPDQSGNADLLAISEDVQDVAESLAWNPEYDEALAGLSPKRIQGLSRWIGEYADAVVKGDHGRAGEAFAKIPGVIMRDVQDILGGYGVKVPDGGAGVPAVRDRVEVARRRAEAAYLRGGGAKADREDLRTAFDRADRAPDVIDGQGGVYNRPWTETKERGLPTGGREDELRYPELKTGPPRGREAAWQQGREGAAPERLRARTAISDREVRQAFEVLDGGRLRGAAAPSKASYARAREIVGQIPYMPREKAARLALSLERDLPGMSVADARQVLSDVDYRGIGIRPDYEQAVDVPKALVAWEPTYRQGAGVDVRERYAGSGEGRDRWTSEELDDGVDEPLEARERERVAGQKPLPGMGPRGEDFIGHDRARRETGYDRPEDVERELLAARAHYDETLATYGPVAAEAQEAAEALGIWEGGSYKTGGHFKSGALEAYNQPIAEAAAGERWGDVKRLAAEKAPLSADRQAYKARAQEAIDRVAEAARDLNGVEARFAALGERTGPVGGMARQLQGDAARAMRDAGTYSAAYPRVGQGRPPVAAMPDLLGDTRPVKISEGTTRRDIMPDIIEPDDVDDVLERGLPRDVRNWLKQNGHNFAVVPAAGGAVDDNEEHRPYYLLAAGGLGGVGVAAMVRARTRRLATLKGTPAAGHKVAHGQFPGKSQHGWEQDRGVLLDTQRGEVAAIVGEDFRSRVAQGLMKLGPDLTQMERQAALAKLRAYINNGTFGGMVEAHTAPTIKLDGELRNVYAALGPALEAELPKLVTMKDLTGLGLKQHELEAMFMQRVTDTVDRLLVDVIGQTQRNAITTVAGAVKRVTSGIALDLNPGFHLINSKDSAIRVAEASVVSKWGKKAGLRHAESLAIADQTPSSGMFGPGYMEARLLAGVEYDDASWLQRKNYMKRAAQDMEVWAKKTVFQRHRDSYFTAALARELGLEDGALRLTSQRAFGPDDVAEFGGTTSARLAGLPEKAKLGLMNASTLDEARAALKYPGVTPAQAKLGYDIFGSHQTDARVFATRQMKLSMRDYSYRTVASETIGVIWPYHLWQTQGVAFHAQLAKRYPLAAAVVGGAMLYTAYQNRDLPYENRLTVKFPLQGILDTLPLPEGVRGEVNEAIAAYKNTHNEGQDLRFSPFNWYMDPVARMIDGITDPETKQNLADISDPRNMFLVTERLMGWKGRSAAWTIPQQALAAHEEQLPEWLRPWVGEKAAYPRGAVGYGGAIARGLGEQVGLGSIPRGVNAALYGEGESESQRAGIRAIMKDRGISEAAARKEYYAQGAKRAIPGFLGLAQTAPDPKHRLYAEEKAKEGADTLPAETPIGDKTRSQWTKENVEKYGDSPSEANARYEEQRKAVQAAERLPMARHVAEYGPEPADEYGRQAWRTAFNTHQGDSPSESNAVQAQQRKAVARRESSDRAERYRFMFETRDYIDRAFEEANQAGYKGTREQFNALPLPGLGGKTPFEFNMAEDPTYDPYKFVDTGQQHWPGAGMGGGALAGLASVSGTIEHGKDLAGEPTGGLSDQVNAIWAEAARIGLSDKKAASAWLNGKYGTSGLSRADFANLYQADQDPSVPGVQRTSGVTVPLVGGRNALMPGKTPTGGAGPTATATGGARPTTATATGPGTRPGGVASSGGQVATGQAKTEYGRQVASFFQTHGQPPPDGSPEAKAYWDRVGPAWRQSFGGGGSTTGGSGSTRKPAAATSSGSAPRTAQARSSGGSTSAASQRSESSPFQRWLDVERPDLKAKYASSSAAAGSSAPGRAERPLEAGVSAKDTAAAWNKWEPLAREGKASVAESVPILSAHVASGGDPAPYVKRAKYGVYEQVRDHRGATRQGGDAERGKWFAAIKALPDDVEGLKKLAGIEAEVRAAKRAQSKAA